MPLSYYFCPSRNFLIQVEVQLKRQDYLVDKVLNNVEDEDQVDLVKGIFIPPNYLVDITDEDPL